MEILSSLEDLTAILNEAGKPASFAAVVTKFEQVFNIELPQPYKIRMQILERKIKCTDFVDRMRRALIERSEK